MTPDTIFDQLEAAILAPSPVWSSCLHAFAVQVASHLFTGFVIGVGIAVGLAVAG